MRFIKANELRIENWVLEPTGGECFIVSNTQIISDYWLGIHLTEEWLLKLGAEKDDQPSWIRYSIGKWFSIYYDKFNKKTWLWFLPEDAGDIEMEFVHQLQNIYFALTYQELTFHAPFTETTRETVKDYIVFKDIHSTITFEDGRKEDVVINGKMKLDFQSQNLNASLNPKP